MAFSPTSFMTVTAILGSLIGGAFAVVLLVTEQPLLAAALAVIAIASLGTLPVGCRTARERA